MSPGDAVMPESSLGLTPCATSFAKRSSSSAASAREAGASSQVPPLSTARLCLSATLEVLDDGSRSLPIDRRRRDCARSTPSRLDGHTSLASWNDVRLAAARTGRFRGGWSSSQGSPRTNDNAGEATWPHGRHSELGGQWPASRGSPIPSTRRMVGDLGTPRPGSQWPEDWRKRDVATISGELNRSR